MYGTIARFRVKPGMMDAFIAWNDTDQVEDRGSGFTLVYRMDRDANELFVVIGAQDRETYRAFSEDPAIHQRYLKMMEFLVEEPEWNDGEVIVSEFRD